MSRLTTVLVLVLALNLLPSAGQSRDAALIISQSEYSYLSNAPEARGAGQLDSALNAEGFTVHNQRDSAAKATWREIESYRRSLSRAERTLVFLSGKFVTNGKESWLLTKNADQLSDITVGAVGVPLSAILRSVSHLQGQALVLLAPEGRTRNLGDGLKSGLGAIDAPQGVSVLVGTTTDLVSYVQKVALRPGGSSKQLLHKYYPDVSNFGYLSDSSPFSQGKRTRGSGPENVEESLNLNLVAKRGVQRDLTILGFPPGAIDGLFGNGTRRAIAEWQTSQDLNATGYLNQKQVSALSRQAINRAAWLDQQASKRDAESRKADNQYWAKVGKGGSKGLSAYLDRFPDGLHSEKARASLKAWEEEQRRRVKLAEQANWDKATKLNSIAGYKAYLLRFPDGWYKDAANQRIKALQNSGLVARERQAAAAKEKSLMKDLAMRRLVEDRLAAYKLPVGKVDGVFDKHTRAALGRFQDLKRLKKTGFVDEATLARLLLKL